MAKDKKFKKMEDKAEKPAVLFSFDGTVMNTKPAVLATYRHVFEHHGKTANFPRAQQIEMLDSSVSSIMRKYLPKENQQKCIDEYDSWQRNHLVDLIQPMNGIDDLLKWLKKNGWKTGIVSTRERSSIIELLEKAHIVSYFDAVVSSSQQDHLAVSDVQLTCRLLHVSNAIFVGDNASSLRAAREAGAFTIGYIAESDMTDIIVEESPDFVTGDFDEVHKLLKGSPLWLAYQVYQPEEIEAMKQKAEKKARKEEEKKQKKEKKKADKKKAKDKNKKKEKSSSEKKEKKPKKNKKQVEE